MRIFLDSKRHIIVQRMEPYWKDSGCIVTKDPKNADIQFSLVYIRTATKLPLVVRLDGVYYNISEIRKNRKISKSHVRADGIIYQSQTSKEMCEKYLLPRRTEIFDIIFNGIESNWCGNRIQHEEINVICTAKWRRWKRLKEVIDIFQEFYKDNKMAYLHISGPLYNNIPIKHPNIKYYGKIDFDRMKELYKIGDIFLHFGRNDPCPKTVSEAIGSGIPVITSDGCGGSSEICKNVKGCYVCTGDKISIEPDIVYGDNFNSMSEKLKKRILKSMRQIAMEKRRILEVPDFINIEKTSEKYLDIFRRVLEKNR